jgi:hypothetical protein
MTVDWMLSGMQSQTERGGEEKNPCSCRESKPDRAARSLVAILSYTNCPN